MARTLAVLVLATVIASIRGSILSGSTSTEEQSYCGGLRSADLCKTLPGACRWEERTQSCVRQQPSNNVQPAPTATLGPSPTAPVGPPAPTAPAGPTPPEVPLPWTTTQQRTHTFSDKEFLSIAEEQSMRRSDDGLDQQAFYIFPATGFSMRNPANTLVKGMRGVFTTDPQDPGWIHQVIFLTNLDGTEYCYANAVSNMTVSSTLPGAPPTKVIRGDDGSWGVEVERWVTRYASPAPDVNPGTLTVDYASERRGGPYASGNGTWVKYPLRLIRDYGNAGGDQRGFMLDQGQHFPVSIDRWFNLSLASSCPTAAQQAERRRSHGASNRAAPGLERVHSGMILADIFDLLL